MKRYQWTRRLWTWAIITSAVMFIMLCFWLGPIVRQLPHPDQSWSWMLSFIYAVGLLAIGLSLIWACVLRIQFADENFDWIAHGCPPLVQMKPIWRQWVDLRLENRDRYLESHLPNQALSTPRLSESTDLGLGYLHAYSGAERLRITCRDQTGALLDPAIPASWRRKCLESLITETSLRLRSQLREAFQHGGATDNSTLPDADTVTIQAQLAAMLHICYFQIDSDEELLVLLGDHRAPQKLSQAELFDRFRSAIESEAKVIVRQCQSGEFKRTRELHLAILAAGIHPSHLGIDLDTIRRWGQHYEVSQAHQLLNEVRNGQVSKIEEVLSILRMYKLQPEDIDSSNEELSQFLSEFHSSTLKEGE